MLDSPELIEPFLIGVSLELVCRDLAITNSGIGKLFFPLPFYRRPHWSTEGALFSLKLKKKFVKTQGVKSTRMKNSEKARYFFKRKWKEHEMGMGGLKG